MTLRDTMAADWATLANVNDFATAGITVTRAAGGAAFAITGVFGDVADGFAATPMGTDENAAATLHTQRSAWRAACLAAQGTAYEPQRGDKLTVSPSTDPMAGDWYVTAVNPDVGDGYVLQVNRPEQYQVGGSGAAAVGN